VASDFIADYHGDAYPSRSSEVFATRPEVEIVETPFPGMDPYLEHPALWHGVHTRLIVALADQIGPMIKPRYIASVEDRVFIESADQERVPDVLVQKATQLLRAPSVHSGTSIATPLVVDVPQLEIREHYITILDRYRDLGVVTVIELVSPTNKAAGPGRDSYLAKQREIRDSECHLVEIDLLRRGSHVMSVPEPYIKPAKPFDYLACVNRWPARNRFELYPCRLRNPLPTIGIPLADPDPDAPLSLQRALEHVYENSGYMLRVLYDEPCKPPLSAEDQEWASAQWSAYRKAHPDLFPDSNGR
jgi:hypothetical protein